MDGILVVRLDDAIALHERSDALLALISEVYALDDYTADEIAWFRGPAREER
jgi:hypothetical protein